MIEFVKVVKAKRVKSLYTRVYARTKRVPPSREKGREKQDEGEGQKREGSGR